MVQAHSVSKLAYQGETHVYIRHRNRHRTNR